MAVAHSCRPNCVCRQSPEGHLVNYLHPRFVSPVARKITQPFWVLVDRFTMLCILSRQEMLSHLPTLNMLALSVSHIAESHSCCVVGVFARDIASCNNFRNCLFLSRTVDVPVLQYVKNAYTAAFSSCVAANAVWLLTCVGYFAVLNAVKMNFSVFQGRNASRLTQI